MVYKIRPCPSLQSGQHPRDRLVEDELLSRLAFNHQITTRAVWVEGYAVWFPRCIVCTYAGHEFRSHDAGAPRRCLYVWQWRANQSVQTWRDPCHSSNGMIWGLYCCFWMEQAGLYVSQCISVKKVHLLRIIFEIHTKNIKKSWRIRKFYKRHREKVRNKWCFVRISYKFSMFFIWFSFF